MSYFKPVFDIWGNDPKQLAAAVGLPVMNCRAWINRDSIPAQYFPEVTSAAARVGALITTDQLIEMTRKRTPPASASA
jgi:hypothetical protein